MTSVIRDRLWRVYLKEAKMAQSPDASQEARLGPVRALRAVFSGVGQLLMAADRFREEEKGRLQAQAETGGPDDDDRSRPLDELSQPSLLKITGNADSPKIAPKSTKSEKTSGKSRGTAVVKTTAGKATAAKTGKGTAKRATRKAGSAPAHERFRSLDSTGNVRVLSEQDKADLAEDELNRHQPVRPAMSLTEVTTPPGHEVSAYSMPDYQAPELADQEEPGVLHRLEQDSPAVVQAALPIAEYDGLSIASLRARLRVLDSVQLRQLADYEANHANRPDVISMFEKRIIKLNSPE
jgi:hypothetical protein